MLSEGESWRLTATLAGHWLLRGYGPYAQEEKGSGAMVGAVGLWFPVDFPEREIKWAIHPACQGRGYASEAARAALALGASLESERDFRGGRFRVYRHPAA